MTRTFRGREVVHTRLLDKGNILVKLHRLTPAHRHESTVVPFEVYQAEVIYDQAPPPPAGPPRAQRAG